MAKGFAASSAQRLKCRDAECVVCGRQGCDPAHLLPRSLGGTAHADAVIPLCRADHDAYDQGRLDLLPHLEPWYRRELAYAVSIAGLETVYRRVTNTRDPGGH